VTDHRAAPVNAFTFSDRAVRLSACVDARIGVSGTLAVVQVGAEDMTASHAFESTP